MVMDVQGVLSGQTASATVGGMINASGWTAPGGQLLNLSGGANTTAYVVSRQSPTTTTTNAMTDNGDARVVAFYNPLPQIVAIDYDDAASPTIKAAVDGLVVLTDSTGNTRSTSALDRVMIGARFQSGTTYDTPYKGKHAAWLLFDKVLDATEHAAAARAVVLGVVGQQRQGAARQPLPHRLALHLLLQLRLHHLLQLHLHLLLRLRLHHLLLF
jgi:hypothetical protein